VTARGRLPFIRSFWMAARVGNLRTLRSAMGIGDSQPHRMVPGWPLLGWKLEAVTFIYCN
jgi:hypothetical protein